MTLWVWDVMLWRDFDPISGGMRVSARVDPGWLEREVTLVWQRNIGQGSESHTSAFLNVSL